MTDLSPSPSTPDLALVERMRKRVRTLRALRAALEFSVFGMAWAVTVVLLTKLGQVPVGRVKPLLLLGFGFPLLGALIHGVRKVSPLLAAHLLDRHYRLHDRIASALQFRALPAAERTPMMDAAIDDAVAKVRERALDPREALAWRWPFEARIVAGLAALLVVVSLVEFRVRHVLPVARESARVNRDPLVLEDDDLQAFRELSQDLQRQAATPGSRETLRRFDQFLEDVSNRRLDRQEAFRRLADLQQTLAENQQADQDAIRRAMQDVGEQMSDRNAMTRDVAQALREGDAERAREAMRQMAERLRNERNLSEQQRQDLSRALQQAAQQREQNQDLQRRLDQARREVEDLLRRQRERQLSQQEESLLRRRQREAEHLQREQQRNEQQRRQAEHLQRALSQAAQDLLRDLQQAAQDLDQGAQDLSRMENEQQSQQSLEELRQRLEELREQMRQQNGQNGQRQRLRLSRFFRAAGGQQGQQGQGQQGQGQQGQGQQGQGQQGQQGQGGNGGQGGGTGMQPGGNGNGPTVLTVGNGGGTIQMPGGNGQNGNGQGQQNRGHEPGGHGAGSEHVENPRGAPVDVNRATQTIQVAGQQTGQGPSRSQVIRTAAADGFASARYRAVYAPYWDHAREVLHQGEVPPGYRSYVRRYFQLIRPREE
jgi:hypothetical protein